MLYALGVLVFLLGVLASIALHEVGHLVPAKRFGVKVTQYMVGFGPTIWSRRRGETEYGLKAIPLGGYIRMIGMFPPERGADPRRLRASSTGMFRAMADDARRQSGDEVGPDDADRVFYRLPVRRKIVVMLSGPVMNLLIAVALFTVLLTTFGVPRPTLTVGTVSTCVVSAAETGVTACRPQDPVAPAARAGLRPGDRLVSFQGEPVTRWEDMQARIRAAGGQTVVIGVEREGRRLDLTATLATNQVVRDAEHPDEYVTAGFLGMSPVREIRALGLAEVPPALWERGARTVQGLAAIPSKVGGLWDASFGGAERDINGPVGIVGVGRLGGEIAALDEVPAVSKLAGLVELLAGLNMALFVFNLVPLLPLDGGHVAGALWEGARRQLARLRRLPDPGPVDMARLMPLTYGVAMVLIAFSLLVLYADIVNPLRLAG